MSRRASPSFIPDEDSRTASFSNKRRQPSRATTPRLESDEEQQHKRQRTEGQTHSFRGASTDFTNHGPTLDSPNMASPASEKSHGLASAVPAKPMIPAMSWNRGRSSGIRATLGPRPGAKKSATTTPQPIPRLAMTSRGANGDREQDKNSSGGSELTGHSNEVESRPEALNEHAHLNLNTAQENGLLSDGEIDSDADDHIDLNQVSDDDGQIVLNMEQDLQRPMPRDVNDEVDDMTRYSQSDPARQENNHNKMLDLAPTASRSSNIHMGTSSPGVQRNGSSSANVVSRSYEYYQVPPETLRDLNPHDFDEQAKYIFFHMDPHRIDLSLPIKCTNCFGTGHLAVVCPDSQCEHCGSQTHQSQVCLKTSRCSKCRQHGHNEGACPSALKAVAGEIPCDLCHSKDHVEIACPTLHRQPHPLAPGSSIELYINCAACSDRTHLIGDCQHGNGATRNPLFSLKGLDDYSISNLSLLKSSNSHSRNSNYNSDLRGPPDYSGSRSGRRDESRSRRDDRDSYRSRRRSRSPDQGYSLGKHSVHQPYGRPSPPRHGGGRPGGKFAQGNASHFRPGNQQSRPSRGGQGGGKKAWRGRK